MPSHPSVRSVRVLIVGSGPAGLTAAIYCARAALKPVVVGGVPSGGQLMLTTDVENYPGFPEGIQGPELMERFRKQAVRFGTEIIDENVKKVDFKHRPFRVSLTSGAEFAAESVIVATGANARWLGLDSEQRLRGHGVSACATCDGFFFRGKEIATVGGGDSAMEEANFLTKFASKVTIIHRGEKFRASQIMQERTRSNPKIETLFNTQVTEVVGAESVEGLKVRTGKEPVERLLPVQGLFLAIGHEPATEVFRGALELDEKGYIRTHNSTRTSVEGVFAAGDVHDHRYRQAVTAAGLGCMAALDAEKYLAEQGLSDHPPPTHP
ncbi:MAG: thioredoxin-disulfide reductase [Candidatus Lutacidiplasmatales archaeon]